ncbi:RraA family protein [Streptomyces vinaceus]
MAIEEIFTRLLGIEVSTLCDADKALPVVSPAIRAMLANAQFAGPALTVIAEDDHLPVFSALAQAKTGDVLVIATNGHPRAVLGELFATEASRRGLAGVVIDGYCRDLVGLRRVGLPVFARGTTPRSGGTTARTPLGTSVNCGGLVVNPGDVVFGDDDGVVIAAPERVAAALTVAETIGRAERSILEGLSSGRSLHELTSWAEHIAALDAGEVSALEFRVDAG